MKTHMLAAALACTASFAAAQEAITYTVEQSFEDVSFGLESAILDRGLVIDHVSHVGEMLERTREDVGSDKVLYSEADVYSFCSASVSRNVMEADLMNIMYCPYDIFVMHTADNPGQVTVGFRGFPDGPMKEVEALLDGIARAAVGME